MFFRDLPARVVAAAIAVFVMAGACGFEPLHKARSGGASRSLATIRIELIKDREGQILRNLLLDRLSPHGPPERPAYLLKVNLGESKLSLGIRRDQTATRANLLLTANFSLKRISDEKEVLSGVVSSTSSFNLLRSEFSTLSAEQGARRRSLKDISDEIRTRVAIFLGRSR